MNGRQDKRDRRAQRLAQALKANLGRRKEQARALAEPPEEAAPEEADAKAESAPDKGCPN